MLCILGNLEKTYARFGLIPSEKQSLEIQNNNGWDMTQIIIDAKKALNEKKKKDVKN